jgi:hypothetical protein
MIHSPRMPPGHPDRGIDCEHALEREVFALLERGRMPKAQEIADLKARAQAAGWTAQEIGSAIISLNERFHKARGT